MDKQLLFSWTARYQIIEILYSLLFGSSFNQVSISLFINQRLKDSKILVNKTGMNSELIPKCSAMEMKDEKLNLIF